MKRLWIYGIVILLCCESFAKKDFRGLFGSYRREKFTENPAEETNYGFDFTLSTLFPVGDLVRSDEVGTGSTEPLNYSVFYNLETSAWFSLGYNWVVFANFGWYNYETRKENALTRDNPNNATTPIFHQFEMTAYPVVGGVRYRFSREDIVPYVSAGIGYAFVNRKGSYDNDPTGSRTSEVSDGAIVGQGALGFEFYFSSYAGLRVEASAYYINLSSKVYSTQGSAAQSPILYFQPNPWSVRYSSGVFIVF